ncbi:MAG TPA: hypothetical protein VL547_20400 [Dinghuibacter sp.]|jgi:hypothetical protein|uniref:hypothetical protein n=1 Tax=Dinghuibacter sp. TaxID=2024697 RepID=UPI002CDD15B0|nr:hypothetical protein [Dinghuibacter sp.]HTJ14416.1 hypothetical protein [Dinghuibacter sp.]
MQEIDHRYKYVRSVWQAGDLNSFAEIFNIIPRSVVAADLHLNYERFTKKVLKPDTLAYRDVLNLAQLTGIDFRKLSELVIRDVEKAAAAANTDATPDTEKAGAST